MLRKIATAPYDTKNAAMPIDVAMAKVNELDLAPINMKLQVSEPEKWTEGTIQAAECTYRRFLAIHMAHPDEAFVPNNILDEYWHQHILDTIKYAKDCAKLFGKMLNHDPYFGLRNENERLENLAGFERLGFLWKNYFGEPLLGVANPCASTDCR